ncbi:MAG: MarR family transcriptional regulator [Rhodobacteraceae bacterium]|nr:MarR family transcriptional regulator [Paracoccaceae bacterium]
MSHDQSAVQGGIPSDLPPELSVLMGVYLLYWKFEEVVERINITPALSQNEHKLLINLPEPRRMGEMAAEMQMLPSTLTAIADGLEGKGMITRERDPDDRRAWRLGLTEKGVQNRHALMSRAVEIFAEVSGLTRAETESISVLMQKVVRNIKADGLPEGATSCR